MSTDQNLKKTLQMLFKPHPWHGIPAKNQEAGLLNAYIEIVPSDSLKYEIDKETGYLKVDRPQKYSNYCPALYGFIPQTYCAEKVAELCRKNTEHQEILGDGDPLDICVLSEKPIAHGDILLKVKPIGGIRMIDGKEADDKIIAVLMNDAIYGSWGKLDDCPKPILDRLLHYFLTYKELPNEHRAQVEISAVYDEHEAWEVINASMADYETSFGNPEKRQNDLIKILNQ